MLSIPDTLRASDPATAQRSAPLRFHEPDLSQTDPLEYNLATRVNIGDALSRAATLFPDRVAVVSGADEITYRQLDDAAERLARSLLDLGLAPQTPLTIMMGNS